MTCIVGYIDRINKVMYMASDRATTLNGITSIKAKSDKKCFIVDNEMIIGVSGNYRFRQLLKSVKPKLKSKKDALSIIEENFIPLCSNKFNESYFGSTGDFIALILYKGRFFTLDSLLGITELITNFYSIGSGAEIALGFMEGIFSFCLMGVEEKIIHENLKDAIKISIKYKNSIREPIDIIQLKY